jgi:hypothetical protein
MQRPRSRHLFSRLLPTLAALLVLAAPALANDFYTPSPVPSSRENIKPSKTTSKQAKTQLNNNVLNNKIVKTTKPVDGTTPTPAAKTPGAL